MDMIVFGAGRKGQEAMQILREEGNSIVAFMDNDKLKVGGVILGIPVISPEQYISEGHNEKIILGSIYKYQVEMEKQLNQLGITNYEYFDRSKAYRKPRLMSYCAKRELEDVLLYHLLKDDDDIFYIDVGSNDPFGGSVTKLLYDMKNAHGINVEPQPWLCELTENERPRDITICAGAGSKEGKMTLFLQDGGSTFCQNNVIMNNCETIEVDVITLRGLCDKYIEEGMVISFLKVDVEGFERDVLVGMDFEKYRPHIVVMESTVPRTEDFIHEEWEDILTNNAYIHVYTRGVNRYYVAEESLSHYQKALSELDVVEKLYHILKAQPVGMG